MTYLNKFISIFLCIYFVVGCSLSPVYSLVADSIKLGLIGGDQKTLTQDKIDSINYSFIQAHIGKGESIIMILESFSNNKYTWVSSSEDKIVTNSNGSLIQTSGLPNNLNVISNNKIHNFKLLEYPFSHGYFVDFDKPILQNLFINSIFVDRGLTEDCILYELKKIKCRVIIEKFTAEAINWQDTNLYKFNENTYEIVSSEVVVHPFLPKLTIRFYK
jgi:hypothetical protein